MMQNADAKMLRVGTTVNIHDEPLVQARELAVRTRRSLGGVVDDPLRLLLSGTNQPTRVRPWICPLAEAAGVQPGIDLEDRDALRSVLDTDEHLVAASHQRAAG